MWLNEDVPFVPEMKISNVMAERAMSTSSVAIEACYFLAGGIANHYRARLFFFARTSFQLDSSAAAASAGPAGFVERGSESTIVFAELQMTDN